MSSAIWTQCARKSKLHRLAVTAFRVVEDQSKNSTRKLVDSDAEQKRLEELIENLKPRLPRGPVFSNLHYLLATPFRYPPLKSGSRFRKYPEDGVWYASENVETALAEKAYYRLRFLCDTVASFASEIALTSFYVKLESTRMVDLTAGPFAAYENQISSPTTYAFSQPLGTDMRKDQVTACVYRSARARKGGRNFAVFSPLAFASKTVQDSARENWYCYSSRDLVELRSLSFNQASRFEFHQNDFEVDGAFPTPDLS